MPDTIPAPVAAAALIAEAIYGVLGVPVTTAPIGDGRIRLEATVSTPWFPALLVESVDAKAGTASKRYAVNVLRVDGEDSLAAWDLAEGAAYAVIGWMARAKWEHVRAK